MFYIMIEKAARIRGLNWGNFFYEQGLLPGTGKINIQVL